MLFQFLVGFKDFDDYLIVFIFVLFLNYLYLKMKRTHNINFQEVRINRLIMSVVFFILFMLPFVFDSVNVSDVTRLTFYKMGFVLWAQVLLVDSFLHYKETHSKKWLVFTNMAALMIVVGAFIH
jgi:hypothetical protein